MFLLYCTIYFKQRTIDNGKYSVYSIPVSDFSMRGLNLEELDIEEDL